MGAWGASIFENDDAEDWVSELAETDDDSLIASSLVTVVQSDSYLELPECGRALAAAEVVAALLGRPNPVLPESVVDWVEKHPVAVDQAVIDLALKASQRIKTNSELKDLWEETGSAGEWYRVLEDLAARLGPATGPTVAARKPSANRKRPKRIKYEEGQWFAVPLDQGGYGLGVIVRGGPSLHGGLGYFFGPRRPELPAASDTAGVQPSDAVLITWFSDLEIQAGRWPLVESARPFSRSAWPVPLFRRTDSLMPGVAWLIEYHQDATGLAGIISETKHPADELKGLPEEVDSGAIALQTKLSRLLRTE